MDDQDTGSQDGAATHSVSTSGVRVGAVVERIFWRVPDWHGYGADFDTHDEACAEARRRKDEGWALNMERPRVYIDERWVMLNPAGSGDVVGAGICVDRTEYFPHETRQQWQERVGANLVAVPDDFPVRVLGSDDAAQDPMTCGTCGRSWDDAVGTSYTPVPAGRCPFEAFHAYDKESPVIAGNDTPRPADPD